MNVAFVVSGIFFIGVLFNLYKGDYENVLAGFAISFPLFVIGWYINSEKKKSVEFLRWIFDSKNQMQILSGTGLYNNKSITKDSKVIQYQFCFSLIFISFTFPTRFLLESDDSRKFHNAAACLFTFLFGWWGVPWGPLYSIQSIYRNLKGGSTQTVESLLESRKLVTGASRLSKSNKDHRLRD